MGQILVVRCTDAQRVTYAGIEEGRFFYCTDTEIMWMGTGSGDVQVGGGSSYSFWDPDALPDTPSSQDDHFDNAALAAKWTEWDLGAAALTVSEPAGHHVILTHTTEGAARYRGIYQVLPAGDFTIAAKCQLIASSLGDSTACLALFEDATDINADILVLINFQRASGNKYRDIHAQRNSDYQTFSANYAGGTMYPNTTVYFRIRRNGTTLYYDYSSDGVSWQRIYTHTQPFAPAQMGIVTSNNNTGITIYGYFDLFRYIASDQIGPLGKSRTVKVE
ncbi:hypothetical protein LCGC14_0461070 [marine sediment metagenome]|uniref:Beta-xylosidase C-terminal Concanavalin A-like domain-containing protein n=1 Tax=marine sediment metagenome TaxID=412755 RepID=A0A0F9SF61_9ZZZZ|nr:hypothetical protein [bacterium]